MKVLLLIASGGGLFFVVGIGMFITSIRQCFRKAPPTHMHPRG